MYQLPHEVSFGDIFFLEQRHFKSSVNGWFCKSICDKYVKN